MNIPELAKLAKDQELGVLVDGQVDKAHALRAVQILRIWPHVA